MGMFQHVPRVGQSPHCVTPASFIESGPACLSSPLSYALSRSLSDLHTRFGSRNGPAVVRKKREDGSSVRFNQTFVDSFCVWPKPYERHAPWLLSQRVPDFSRLEHLPDEMGEQSEQKEHECADPEQEFSGQLWGFDFFLVHSSKDTLRSVVRHSRASLYRTAESLAVSEVEGMAVPHGSSTLPAKVRI
jgi:hypothetical protein